ncbi:MAG: hypothetical protein HYY06_13535 [Deltaproteobacteria bacterium]|nr:hypothetical protein [Deltaproteobacteria bacterium]
MVRALRSWAVVIGMLVPATASAQPFGQPPEQPPPATPPSWEAAPAPVQPTAPEQPPQSVAPSPPIAPVAPPVPQPPAGPDETAPPDPGPARERPETFSIGVGFGYDLPSDLQLLDTTSVRFRLRSGFTIEPFVTAAFSSTSFEFGDEDTQEDSTTQLGVGANFRIPVKGHGPVDFVLVAGGKVETVWTDPDGADDDTETNTISIIWGLAVEYWFGQHVAVSLTATNPFASYTQVWEEQEGDDITESSSAFGVIFDPNVALMLHLFL